MKKAFALLFFIVSLHYSASAQNVDKRLNGIDTFINRVLKDWHAAGVAVAVVDRNKVVLAKGFGYKDYAKRTPVTENTLFAIGSCSKAFTSSLLGLLVKEGKLDLDKPVHDYLPELKFYNDHLTLHVTARDMMCHRTGLPRHDYSWYGSKTSRDSLIYRIRFLEPNAELRQRYQYNNFMFLAQGVLAEKLYGKKWEMLVKEKIFDPLGMNNSDFSVNDLQKSNDFSYGYREHKDSVLKMEYMNIDPIGPAGSINSTATDMSKWLITWINGGKYNGKEVLPASYVADAMSSQMVIGGALPTKDVPDVSFANYGFAWSLVSYRAHYRVEHGGNIDGFSATTCFFPADSIGIVVLVNQNGSAVPGIIRNTIADRMLGLPYRDWNKFQRDALVRNQQAAKLRQNTDSANRKANTKPSHPLNDYVGVYDNPGYGKMEVLIKKDTLWAEYNGSNGKTYLDHYHYDVFKVRSIDPTNVGSDGDANKVRFITNNKGEVITIETQMEPTVKDIVFTKLPATIKIEKNELQKYTGEYELDKVTVKVFIKGENTLMVFVPGQPEYELVPTKKDEFDFKTLKGFSVKFEVNDKGEIAAVNFVQPNGIFKATRKK
jgi:CubicO group peptidase (beta-lactamase class C family)